MSDVIPVRIGKGRKRHALPQGGNEQTRTHTLCGRDAVRSVVDDAFPDCVKCLKIITKLGTEVVSG